MVVEKIDKNNLHKPQILSSNISSSNWDGGIQSDITFGELQKIQKTIMVEEQPSLKTHVSSSDFTPYNYLTHIESSIPNDLISPKNYSRICNLASIFNNNITSFFGFETRLNKMDGCVDYLLAISSKKGEREALLDLLKRQQLPTRFLQKPEWGQIQSFVEDWSNEGSILNKNVLGIWLEFDTAYSSSESLIPGLFVQIKPISKEKSKDPMNYSWITEQLFPALTGKRLDCKNEEMINKSIKQLPNSSFLLFVAAMISRESSIIRTTIKMNSNQIIPYLESLGWKDENNGLDSLLEQVSKHSTRIILHMDIGKEINPKIGIECSFSPDLYHFEKRWDGFFDYLIKEGACLPEKKEQLISFMRVDQEDNTNKFSLDSYLPAVKFNDNNFSGTIVKYLSHIKIQYKPNGSIFAKAYPGVRLFGKTN
ncbi:MAG: hypothetical protein DRN27_07170 [Thermoplasmata archaeon]|nr:MAG: hypothetical protein DRN27_07170 [Thermoplasmata archaeon]